MMKDVTVRKIAAVVLGNLILGVGIAILRISQMEIGRASCRERV